MLIWIYPLLFPNSINDIRESVYKFGRIWLRYNNAWDSLFLEGILCLFGNMFRCSGLFWV